MDEFEKSYFTKLHDIDILKHKINNKLLIDFEACKEIKDESVQLKALESIIKKYWSYFIEWGKISEIKFVKNDFSFTSVNLETDEIIWNDNFNSEEIRFSDIEGKVIGSNLEFENDNERYKHKAYQELISQIYPVIKYKDELLRKVEFKQKFKSKDQITGFECNLQIDFKKVHQILTDNGYIEAEQSNFEAAFNPTPIPSIFKPVIWIKKSTRNKELNKKSLIDLLKIVGVKDIDISKINILFAKPDGNSIDMKSSNIFNNRGNDKSEYYFHLEKILSVN